MTNTSEKTFFAQIRRNLYRIVCGVACVAILFVGTYRYTGSVVASILALAISAALYLMFRLWKLRKLRIIEAFAWVLVAIIGGLLGFLLSESLNGILIGLTVALWLIVYFWHWFYKEGWPSLL